MSKVSVIVPIYNVEKYLEECINSIINQSIKDIEIILVNDGSTDNSVNILRKFTYDKRIKIINKVNEGLSSARNVGLLNATAKYVIFVDSDDIINVKMIEKLYNTAIEYECDIVQCFYERFDNIENLNNKQNEDNKIENSLEILDNLQYLNRLYDCNYINTVVTWNKIYKKELFEDIKFPFGKLHEDEFVTYKLIYNSKKIGVINEKLYYYRTNQNSIVRRGYNVKRLDALVAFEERIDFFNEKHLWKLKKLTIEKYLQNILSSYLRVYYEIEDNNNILKI